MKKNTSLAIPELKIQQGQVVFRRGTDSDIENMGEEWFASDLPTTEIETLTPEIIEASRRYWLSLLQHGEILLVGVLEDQLVGRVFINITARQKTRSAIKVDHPTGIIERLKVAIEHQGIGRALIENAEHIIVASGLSAAEIGVHQSNTRALSIYEELGYTSLVINHEERSPSFEGFITFRYQRPTAVLFKYLL